ncbi:unnamed protein product [Mytilus coruscus]|uniref:Uncharacterized protein n=1 Tax=Mytilus coruscus TaxID=42192 RepID=A0A6J8A0D1_MYTCO|nr:unnamed protein product [Mytilus coruscus]
MQFSSLLLVVLLLHSGTTRDCVFINGSDFRADCHNQNLTGIPQDLPIDIENLDLSENNLGVTSNKPFSRYSHLKTLELQNSKIHTVEPEGFDGLNSLENLSLAGNALNISNLSCLEHIDLSGNRFGFASLGIQMLTVVSKLSNSKMFDFSFIPLRYKIAYYLPVINDLKPNQSRLKREDENCSDAGIEPLNISIPPLLEFVRITQVLGAPPLN